MPRFHFHIRIDGGYIHDHEGVELPDLAAVRGDAMVDDENGKPVLTLAFREAVTIED